jgi:DNA polymerase elongation subunit (family B)
VKVDRADPGHQRIATFDIETTHYDAAEGEVVSVGVGLHERGKPLSDMEMRQFHRRPDRDEEAVIRQAYNWIDEQSPDFFVSFNGRYFDTDFTDARLARLGGDPVRPSIDTDETHLDLLHDDRKQLADDNGDKFPSLEEVVESYTGEAPPEHYWRGDELDNVRFGEELGPAYLNAVEREDAAEMTGLEVVIDSYLRQDLLHNLQIYYHDIGEF